MISVAARGYGIVIWDGEGAWRTIAVSDTLSALLAARVEIALDEHPRSVDSDEAVCAALLSIAGARVLAVECGHGPGGCDEEIDRN